MSEVRIIENGVECEAAELLCIKCYNRWIGTYPAMMHLKDAECPNCKHIGLIIKTGQTMYINNTPAEQPAENPEVAEDIQEEEPNE